MAKSKETSLIPTESGFEFVQEGGECKVLPLHKLALVSKIMGGEESEEQFDFPEYGEDDVGSEERK